MTQYQGFQAPALAINLNNGIMVVLVYGSGAVKETISINPQDSRNNQGWA